ncbi:MAG TPA: ACT domain-containing protein, partial [Paludibacteraceae bacterium]|nr:ACT domain-containing protein [Paludibacteraceae bacterium]
MSREIILINISGEDKPGVMSSITNILGRYDATILDIGQADIHHTLSLGILFKIDSELHSGAILKDILFKCSELGVTVKFTPVSEENYNSWVGRQGKSRYIVTILGKVITARQISLLTKAISDQNLNIDSIKRLTGRPPLDVDNLEDLRSCIEFSVRGTLADKNKLSDEFLRISANEGIDISFQRDDMYRRNRRLICFDMDSTLIKTEVIDELAER